MEGVPPFAEAEAAEGERDAREREGRLEGEPAELSVGATVSEPAYSPVMEGVAS
jgi:hypothetical protein